MTETDIQFIEDNIINFESVKLGFTRHIDHRVLNEYQRIYHKYLDSNFNLNAWCGACVFDMLNRLTAHYEGVKYANKLKDQ